MATRELGERVAASAEQTLHHQKFVSPIDVLTRMRLLDWGDVERWRRGQIPYLEQAIPCRPEKLKDSLALFRKWAESQGLKPAETEYKMQERGGALRTLKFTPNGDTDRERFYNTQWLSAALPEKKQKQLVEKAGAPKDLVVFCNIRASKCSECQVDLPKGGFLKMENEGPLCLDCADMGHLEFLPSGDAALTRRSGKYSKLKAVVVQFSRSRGRYERQGLLVEPAALEQAEKECLDDEDARQRRREREEEKRKLQDVDLAARMAERIRELYPGMPAKEAKAIADHTARRGSGRVGRTEAGRKLEEDALHAAVVASVRHNHTNYDELLLTGVDRATARANVREQIEDRLDQWAAESSRSAGSS